MSKTVSMVAVTPRRRTSGAGVARCTWCGGPLVDGLGVVDGRMLRNALVCQSCGNLGVRCECARLQ